MRCIPTFLLAGSLLVSPVSAQDSFSAPLDLDHRVHVVTIDHVSADLSTNVQHGERGAAERTVETRGDGLYHVRIRSAQHIQRMEGSYLDAALSVPHGRFVYYHPNGRIESVGEYQRGVKVGTWYTQDITGQGRDERTYSGLAVEDLLVAKGVQERARTLIP